jgi:hypothetical protein
MATTQELEQALIAADAAGDVEAATLLAREIQIRRETGGERGVIPMAGDAPLPSEMAEAQGVQPQQVAQVAQQQDGGILTTLKNLPPAIVESVTGAQRATEATRTLPEWTSMPELNSFSFQSARTGLGTLLSTTDQAVEIIKANYPATEVMQDEKGNFILRSSIDGKDYAIPPGFSMGDIPRGVAAARLFAPYGAGSVGASYLGLGAPTTILGAGARGAGIQTGIEAAKVGAGAEFKPYEMGKEVAVTGALEAFVPGAARVVKALRGTPTPPPPRIEPTMDGVTPPVSAPAMPMRELAETTRVAAGETRIPGAQTRAMQVLASETAPDPKTIEAAKRLGIDQYLQPDHVTTNQVYRELAQAVKSVPGSQARAAELEGFRVIGDRADKLVAEIGGTKDLSTLSATVQKRMQSQVDELATETQGLFDNVINKAIPVRAEVNPQSILNYLITRGEDLGGLQNLSAMEKDVFRRLSPQVKKVDGVDVEVFPTYAQLDQVRKDIGSAYKQAGPFKDADRAALDQLYGPLAQDQKAVAQSFGVGDAFEAANKAVGVRKSIEKDMTSLFGKQLHLSMVDNITGAMRALPKGDEKKLINLLKAVPADMRQEVVASGLNTAFGRAALDKKLGFNEYATWYQGLLENKQAYAAVMSNLPPGASKQLSDLYRVSRGIALSSKERIVTGRIQAAQQALFDNADNFIGKIVELGQKGAIVSGVEMAGRSVGLPGAGIAAAVASAVTKKKTPMQKAADDLLSSREFLQAARDVAQGNNQKAAEQVAKSKAFTKLAKELGMPQKLDYRVQWLLSTMQSGRQFGEENK